jgi:histidinol dehydrogenase
VAGKLGDILISHRSADYARRLGEFRKRLESAARFGRFPGYDSQENLKVVEILRDVAENGDAAVACYTKRFDGVDLKPAQFRVRAEDVRRALEKTDPQVVDSIRGSIENVRRYQQGVLLTGGRPCPGIRYNAVASAGVCVPGAAAPLPSTVVMTVVPAQVAGVERIAVVCPPRISGGIAPAVLATCGLLGVDEVYRVGGVQAVAALAAGTETIPKVDMIVGPGNKWVQSAKKNVALDYVAIDSVAGPSEVLIIADSTADPAWVAADMLSQAEHADDSAAVAITDCGKLASAVVEQLETRLGKLPRAGQARKSLEKLGAVIEASGIDEAVETADELAFEHVQVLCGGRSRQIAERIRNAGAIFIGPYSPVAAGDYWAGPSHCLPTGQRAKFSSALTANDFVKSVSIIEYDRAQLHRSAADIIRLAETEGLSAHAESVRIRLDG